MTGLESAAIAGKVVATAVKSTAEDPKDREALRELAKESGALNPAARAYAKRLAVKEQIRLKIWQPLGALFGVSRDYFDNDFGNDLSDRMALIPEDDLITPRLSVAGPAVQGIAFTLDEPNLKAMYLNLLAAASDKRVASQAHPSFADIIRQLTAEEAVGLGPVLDSDGHTIIEVRIRIATMDRPEVDGYNIYAKNVMNWTKDGRQIATPDRALYIDNWERLGLVKVSLDTLMKEPTQYTWVDTNPQVTAARAEFDTEEFTRVDCKRGALFVTDFGRKFHELVIEPPLD